MDWIKKAPTALVIAVIAVCGVLALGLLAAYVVLAVNGQDTAEFRQWVNTIGQLLLLPLTGTAAVAAVSSARSAGRAEDQTNGQLDRRDEQISDLQTRLDALRAQQDGDV